MDSLKEWWYSRHSVINVAIKLAFLGLFFRFVVLDYGLEFNFKLPYVLNKLNPICWLTKGLYYAALGRRGNPGFVLLSKLWRRPKHKLLEFEMALVDDLISLGYHWDTHTDHCGHHFVCTIAGLELSVNYIDRRHWNDSQDSFVI